MSEAHTHDDHEEEVAQVVAEGIAGEEFGERHECTRVGYRSGPALGGTQAGPGLQSSAVGQWLVRDLAGEGESLLEGVYASRQGLH